MWSQFRRLHAALAIICSYIVPWLSSTPLNNTTLFANADWDSGLCWGCSNELNEPLCVCMCIYVLLSAGDVMANQTHFHFCSPLEAFCWLALLDYTNSNGVPYCGAENANWSTPAENIFLTFNMCGHWESKHLPPFSAAINKRSRAAHPNSDWSMRAALWYVVENTNYSTLRVHYSTLGNPD